MTRIGIPVIIWKAGTTSAYSITGLAKKVPNDELNNLEKFINDYDVDKEMGGSLVKYLLGGGLTTGLIGLGGILANYFGANLPKDVVINMATIGSFLSFPGLMQAYYNVDAYFAKKKISERKSCLTKIR